MTELAPDFKPPWWLRNPHVQSLYANIAPKNPHIVLRWEELSLPDGDFIDLAWSGPADAPLVILLHGVEGSVFSHYIQATITSFITNGMQILTMHYRACSGRMNRLPHFYDGGDTKGDFRFLMDTLQQRFPDLPLFAMGFSIGGNILLRYLAHNHNTSLRAAVAVSVPFELGKSSDFLAPFYQKVLLRSLKKKIQLKMKSGVNFIIDKDRLKDIASIREFDALVTAPMFRYPSIEKYYELSSCRSYLKHIHCPNMIFHAWDDPFVPRNSVPEQKELSPSTVFQISEKGGHMGFLKGGLPWRPQYWLSQRIFNFFDGFLV
jgi:uncharacterized protein